MVHPVLRVSSTVRIPNPARRLGTIPELSVRWAEAVARVQNELPANHPLRGNCNGMMSELALDDLLDGLEAAKAQLAPPPDTPERREAVREYYDMRRQWNACCIEIKNAQGFLQRAVNNWKHRLLADISTDCFHIPNQLPATVGDLQSSSIHEARQLVKELLPRLQWARGVLAKITEARCFDTQPTEQQAISLISALYARLQESQGRVIALEAQTTALEAQLNRLQRGRKKKAPITKKAAA
jgi:hypothetical protein